MTMTATDRARRRRPPGASLALLFLLTGSAALISAADLDSSGGGSTVPAGSPTLAAPTAANNADATSSSDTAGNESSRPNGNKSGAKRGEEALTDPEVGTNLDPHPDPNEEHYPNMVYVGRHRCGSHHSTEEHVRGVGGGGGGGGSAEGAGARNVDGDSVTTTDDEPNQQQKEQRRTRLGHDVDNGIKYIFGTSFDDTHKQIEEEDLKHERFGPDVMRDVADRAHPGGRKSREEVLRERRHGKVDERGPKPFGHADTHPLDGGVTPPKVVHVDPFFMDETPITNKEFGKFVRSTYYETEAEGFGWSFVLSSFLPRADMLENADVDPEAEHWAAVDGAYWRQPEGVGTSYKFRENHPVVHVSHRDAAEYCKWVGKRLPGEREWEAAARAGHYGPKNRTLYGWGEDGTVDAAKEHANLWGEGDFPWENRAEDGWRGTSPVRTYKPNRFGLYDTTGNVWEWMRGGKHKARIVRGASYVDSFDGSFNHAATLGARATLHGTTATGNVGFRCAKAPERRTEYHWVYHDEEVHGRLAVEDEFGKRDMMPQRGWEDQFEVEDDGDEFESVNDGGEGYQGKRKKRKVVMPRTRRSDEL